MVINYIEMINMKKILILESSNWRYEITSQAKVCRAVLEADIVLSKTGDERYFVVKHRGDCAEKFINRSDLGDILNGTYVEPKELTKDVIPDPSKLRAIAEPVRQKQFNNEMAKIIGIISEKIEERANEGYSFFKSSVRDSRCEINIAFEDCRFIEFCNIEAAFKAKGYAVEKYSTGTWVIAWGNNPFVQI